MESSGGKERMIAYCGLICTECPAYRATQAGDAEKIATTAELWTKEYGLDVTPDDVWCDGCLPEGRKCAHCGRCEIRACAREKEADNCGVCAEFSSCARIQEFFKMAPMAREVLEEIASSS